MSLMTYAEVRPWAKAIRSAVLQKKMPPWFADPAHGVYGNDPSLSTSELETLIAWIDAELRRAIRRTRPGRSSLLTGGGLASPTS